VLRNSSFPSHPSSSPSGQLYAGKRRWTSLCPASCCSFFPESILFLQTPFFSLDFPPLWKKRAAKPLRHLLLLLKISSLSVITCSGARHREQVGFPFSLVLPLSFPPDVPRSSQLCGVCNLCCFPSPCTLCFFLDHRCSTP